MGRLTLFQVSLSSANETSCEEIQTACGRAGCTRDVPGAKDLMAKCYDPILQVQSVSGVKVSDENAEK
jgi:hypothetical protein